MFRYNAFSMWCSCVCETSADGGKRKPSICSNTAAGTKTANAKQRSRVARVHFVLLNDIRDAAPPVRIFKFHRDSLFGCALVAGRYSYYYTAVSGRVCGGARIKRTVGNGTPVVPVIMYFHGPLLPLPRRLYRRLIEKRENPAELRRHACQLSTNEEAR